MLAKISKDGRVTVPKRIRDYLGLEVGGEVAFRRGSDRSIVVERVDGQRPPSRIAKLCGIAGPGPSTDEIMELLRGDD